jgi:phthalate 4,5-dioxygenase reductase subunit
VDENPEQRAFTDLVVTAADRCAVDIVRFELRHPDGAALPQFEPGAHLPVRAPDGALRRYSLCNDPAETDRYEIAVKRDAQGRGGSMAMTDQLIVGSRLPVAAPEIEFALHPRAKRFLFIAGGIGITPIMSMMRHLLATGGPRFDLHYCTRSPAHAAFASELEAPEFAGRVHFHHDDGDPAHAFDFWPLLEKPTGAHVYCCGPRALMDAVRDMSGHWPFGSVHFESFGIDAALRQTDRPFAVVLSRSGTRIDIPANRSILETLRLHGHVIRSSCEAGSCGSCRTGLVSGEVDHRDFVLGEAERADRIMVCVSRARSGELVLDL